LKDDYLKNRKNNTKSVDYQEIVDAHEELVLTTNELTEIYGEQELIPEITSLAEQDASSPGNNDPDARKCCDRNEDGTVNGSCCNFWENIVAGVRSALGCTVPEFIFSETSEQFDERINDYYDCLQQKICVSC